MKIKCPFTDSCANYKIMCDKCTWNKALEIDDYLEIKDTKLVLLEKDGVSSRKRMSTLRNVD